MATLLTDNITVGIPPITPPIRTLLSGVVSSQYEFKPTLGPAAIARLLQDGEIANSNDYISPYQDFSLTISAIPTDPLEVITAITLTMNSCVLEEPLPGADITRSQDTEFEIPVTPYWAPPLFVEPFVIITPSGPTVSVSGYFTERNFYDQEWILQYENAIAKFSATGIRFTRDKKGFVKSVNFLETLTGIIPAGINVNNFYPMSIAAAYTYGPEVMQSYILLSERVISYKPSEIKKLRFYFTGNIISNRGTFPFTAHMTVQNNKKAAQERLRYALNRRTFGGLLPGI